MSRALLLYLLVPLSAASDVLPAHPVPLETIDGIWIDRAVLASLPTTGAAWEHLVATSQEPLPGPDLSDQDDPTNVRVLARALVYARQGDERLRQQVIAACLAAIGTEAGGRTLSLGRELAAYVIAADLVGLPPAEDVRFRQWLRASLDRRLQGRTLRSTQEDRPNNWGTHAAASRIAVALYLRDGAELERAARVFKGYLGDRSAYAGFRFGGLDWQLDPRHPVGINPLGARKGAYDVDGVPPDDQRRCCSGFTWPPPRENYVWEAMQGALAAAVMLDRAGYDVWSWQDRALYRVFRWLHEVADYPARGDDTWQPHIVNHFYGSTFPAPVPSKPGKNVGFTDWTHAGPRRAAPAEAVLAPPILETDDAGE